MKIFRGNTNSFYIGSSTPVLTIPKEIADELDINNAKKSYFNIYTDFSKGKKRIIYEFTQHAEKTIKTEEEHGTSSIKK